MIFAGIVGCVVIGGGKGRCREHEQIDRIANTKLTMATTIIPTTIPTSIQFVLGFIFLLM
jgi:hypothetical protein